ncbi:hypothetical protein IIA15_00255 [candidate division TA06 bacterium]|nr:hypothetical protein [candidate division TA06 bacterium]
MKSTKDIRKILGEETENLRNGKITPAILNAIVNAADKIIQTLKVELEYAKLNGKKHESEFIEEKAA